MQFLRYFEQMKAVGTIDVKPCPPYSSGLGRITVSNINELMPNFNREAELPSNADVLWLCSKIMLETSTVKGWNGFMTEITNHLMYDVSRIIYLPFINKVPGHYDTMARSVLSSLMGIMISIRLQKLQSINGITKCVQVLRLFLMKQLWSW